METDLEKRVNELEDDFKLIKGEIRSTVFNVRDFMGDIKTITSQIEADAAFSASAEASGGPNNSPQPPPESPPAPTPKKKDADPPSSPEENMKPTSTPEKPAQEKPPLKKDDPRSFFAVPTVFPDTAPPVEQKPEKPADKHNQPGEDAGPNLNENKTDPEVVPQQRSEINPLVNLISWLARVKKELGKEGLASLLDVYSFSAPISPDLRGNILKLSAIIFDKVREEERVSDLSQRIKYRLSLTFERYSASGQLPDGLKEAVFRAFDDSVLPADNDITDTWERLLLELNGILAGNEALFAHLKPAGGDKKAQEEDVVKKQEKEAQPLKLKLVLPSNGGGEKEFFLNLIS